MYISRTCKLCFSKRVQLSGRALDRMQKLGVMARAADNTENSEKL